jgi:hypothetical protein
MARGMKEQIETVFPEIAGLNQSQSDAIGLDAAMSRRVWQMENSGGVPTSIGEGVKKILDHPDMYSRLAILLAGRGVKNVNQFISNRLAAVTAAAQAGASSAITPQ